MKTLREYIDLIDKAQRQDEGIKSALAGAALAGAMALGSPAQAQSTDIPSDQLIKQQIYHAIRTKQIPMPQSGNLNYRVGPGYLVKQVQVNGEWYDITDPLPQAQKVAMTADQIRGAMREEDLTEVSQDALDRVEDLYRDA